MSLGLPVQGESSDWAAPTKNTGEAGGSATASLARHLAVQLHIGPLSHRLGGCS